MALDQDFLEHRLRLYCTNSRFSEMIDQFSQSFPQDLRGVAHELALYGVAYTVMLKGKTTFVDPTKPEHIEIARRNPYFRQFEADPLPWD